ncbi:MAG: Ig-like domain-containing protein [Planctomycetota bacterium]|nr:Ig-like domain-containing protein [Planctomycetota bacterium]
MSFSGSRTLKSFAKSAQRLLGKRRRTEARRLQARRRFLEQLEPRNLMAVDIVSLSPADNSINWPLNTDLQVVFSQPVVKGQGAIHVVNQATGTLGIAVDVNSPSVSISGSTVTVDLPSDLLANTAYTVFIDNGAFLDTTGGPTVKTAGATTLVQDFEFIPLSPFTLPIPADRGDGTDFSLTPPLNWTVDNTQLPTGGLEPYRGWSVIDKNSWIREAGGQSRDAFTRGVGSVGLGDPDQFDDAANGGPFNSKFISRPIKLEGVTPGSVVLEFDSSFRPEFSQVGTLEVRFDGGAWENLLTLNPSNTSNDGPSPTVNPVNLNERLVTGTNTGVSTGGLDNGKGNVPIRNIQNPANAATMELRWSVTGGNTWWWAIDNVKVSAEVVGVPFLGITNATTWNLDIPTLTVGINQIAMSENGGSAVGTVTRNGSIGNWADPLVVTLANSDTTEATIPATVTIPANQASVTFAIAAVDDAISDRKQTVTITADAPTFVQGVRSIDVLDDEGPKIVTVTPADNSTNVDYQSNLVINFDSPVRKGNGLISILRSSDSTLIESINVNDSNPAIVVVSGSTVTVNPRGNLPGVTEFYVLVDEGAFVDLSSTPTAGAILLQQSFDRIVTGTTPPTGFNVTPGGGWSFISKANFIANGGTANFTSGQGTVAVTSAQDSFLQTTPINLTGMEEGSVVLEFDAAYRGGLPKLGTIDVSYDGGLSWIGIAQFSGNVDNTRVVISSTGVTGATALTPFSNPTSGSMVFRFGQQFNAGGYLAIDNLQIKGGVVGLPFQGVVIPTDWSFTTAVAPTLTLTINQTTINENGGTAIGTVTRNISDPLTPALVVTLVNGDPTEVSIPATVTIPAGQASVTFTINAVNDTEGDGLQTAVITPVVVDYFSVPASINVADDDFPKVVTFSPADNSTAVPVNANLVVTFDQQIKKGNGFVHIIRTSDGKAAQSIDIQSPAVTISGSTVTINPSADLRGLTDYYVSFERGAILNTVAATQIGGSLLTQDFELLPLGPAVFETVGLTPNGKDFTITPPSGFQVDNTLLPAGGVPEWNGWTFAEKSFWSTQGGQNRALFTRGQGTIAVGDVDEWDDTVTFNNGFNGSILTSPINLTGVAAGTAVLSFDSSFRPEDSQIGKLDVTYDGGATWENLLTLDPSNTSNATNASNINERRTIALPSQPSSGIMQFRWNVQGANDWWWAIDNINVIGDTSGLAYPGIANTEATVWNFTTADVPVSLSVAPTPIAENGGTAVVTVTRNLGTTGDLVVNLASGDTSIATVPQTVTILDGQASATFNVTAVNNAVAHGIRNVTISAATAGFNSTSAVVSVADDEIADVVITEIMYAPAGGAPVNGTTNTNATKREWIEVVNRGTATADLSGWSFDDEDVTNWGKIPNGTTLAPGQVGVFYNGPAGGATVTQFRNAWNVPANAIVVGVFWGDLANTPAAVAPINENILLRDSSNATIDTVNYDDIAPWPANVFSTVAGAAFASSIYLTSVASDNNIGASWAASVVGVAGAINPVPVVTGVDALGNPVSAAVYAVTDRGSPGALPLTAPTISNIGDQTTAFQTPTAAIPVTVFDAETALNDLVLSVTSSSNTALVPVANVTFGGTGGNRTLVVTPASGQSGTSIIVIRVTDGSGAFSEVFFTLTVQPAATAASVVGRNVFYNNAGAVFGTNGANATDPLVNPVLAIDPTKSALLPGGTAGVANFTNYSRGINGLVIDITNPANLAAIDASSFQFATWSTFPDATPNFVTITPTVTVSTFATGGQGGSARVKLTFPDRAIENAWLRVTVLANPLTTGLTANDVFYFGNARFDVNSTNATVQVGTNILDTNQVRGQNGQNSGIVSNVFDVDRSGAVNVLDTNATRGGTNVNSLRFFNAPASLQLARSASLGTPAILSQGVVKKTLIDATDDFFSQF